MIHQLLLLLLFLLFFPQVYPDYGSS